MMRLVDRYNDYDFYIGHDKVKTGHFITLYNIVPTGSQAPVSGYKNMLYIEKVKGIVFPDRYQPTKHGMSNLYLNGDSNE